MKALFTPQTIWLIFCMISYTLMIVLFYLNIRKHNVKMYCKSEGLISDDRKSWTYREVFILAYLSTYKPDTIAKNLLQLPLKLQRSEIGIRTMAWRLKNEIGLCRLDKSVLQDLSEMPEAECEVIAADFMREMNIQYPPQVIWK